MVDDVYLQNSHDFLCFFGGWTRNKGYMRAAGKKYREKRRAAALAAKAAQMAQNGEEGEQSA